METQTNSNDKILTPLNSSWTLWFHHPEDNNWSLKSYQKIGGFSTIEEFWSLQINDTYFHLGMFFLMRENITPIWEDTENINGGCWSFKIAKKDVYETWIKLSAALIGETVYSSNPTNITGISISPKRGFCIMKIWNKSHTDSDTAKLTQEINTLISGESIYKKFKE